MNVAIVTQPIKANYGGVLQNFALQCVLRKLGHHPVTIDYRDSSPLWFYLFQTIKTILLYPFSSKRRALTPYRNVFPRDKRIMKFVYKYIKLTDNQYLSYNKDIIQKYKIGAVIVGSDQVWRPRYSPNCLYDTYLSFLKNEKLIKISYAASFGVDSWEYTDKQTKVCKELMKQFNGDLQGKTVALWGLAFKPETDDMREAPALVLIDKLLEAGCRVRAYDPAAVQECKRRIGEKIYYACDMYDAVLDADVLMLVTEWKEFRLPSWAVIKKTMAQQIVLDGRNIDDKKEMEELGFVYHCIGK